MRVREASQLKAVKVREEDHECIIEETISRAEPLKDPDCEKIDEEAEAKLMAAAEKAAAKEPVAKKSLNGASFCEQLAISFCECQLHR